MGRKGVKDLVILGAGGFVEEVIFLIHRINQFGDYDWKIKGIIDKDFGRNVMGYPILGDDNWLWERSEEINLVCAVGSVFTRKKIISRFEKKSNFHFPNLIDPSVIYDSSVQFGKGIIICAGTILTVNITIGDFTLLNLDCTVGHGTIIEDYVTINPSVNISGNVKISSGTEIGTGSHIIQGISVGKNSIIGAGAVIIRDIEGDCTVVGNPGRIIKKNE